MGNDDFCWEVDISGYSTADIRFNDETNPNGLLVHHFGCSEALSREPSVQN